MFNIEKQITIAISATSRTLPLLLTLLVGHGQQLKALVLQPMSGNHWITSLVPITHLFSVSDSVAQLSSKPCLTVQLSSKACPTTR